MALETWLLKVKKSISHSFDAVRAATPHSKPALIKKSNLGVLAFEAAGLMSKLLHIWQSLSDKNIAHLKNHSIFLEGVRKIVSNDDDFLLSLACAEMVEILRCVSKSLSRMSKKCQDSSLRAFDRFLNEFADSGRDPNNWVLTQKEMEAKCKKMNIFVTSTSNLHKEMDELSVLETCLKKSMNQLKAAKDGSFSVKEHSSSTSCNNSNKIIELKRKIIVQKQEMKNLKEISLWSKSFDSVTSLLARSIFTVLARIKIVFGIGHHLYPPYYLPRCISASATVYPSNQPHSNNSCNFVSGPLIMSPKLQDNKKDFVSGPLMIVKDNNTTAHVPDPQERLLFFESYSNVLKPQETTLGAVALCLHYANLIIVMEKMIRSPQLIGIDARDDLYSMLPKSIRSALRARLKGIGFSATDAVLAAEWREALHKILGWLSPLAHNMIKWQSERSLEQQKLMPKKNINSNVLLFQTLYFANQEKTEAAITELLVGLNYVWRFEREMNAKALFESINFNMLLSMQHP
ncbi:hypothetical protein Leryth_027688 [Lithospermum erythrorhizon]|nr:hypothetical protein Leryth_027688 [Lithospermum erythrorhizon]